MKIVNISLGKYGGLVKNTLIFGVGLIGAKFVQFILLPYFTNVLTTAEYGMIDLVVTFVGLIVPLVTLELSDSVLRFGLSNKTDKKELVKNSGIILIISSIITVIFSPLLFFYESVSKYRWYIVLLIITQAFRTNEALFVKAINKITVYSLDSVLTAAIIASFDVLFISKLDMSVHGYFLAEIIGNFCSIIFLMFAGKVRRYISFRGIVNWKLLKQMLKYSIPLMFNALSWWITTFSDRMILDMFFSTNEVGIYSVSTKIPAIVTTLLSVFTQAWIISAVREYESEKDKSFFENVYVVYATLLFSFVSILLPAIKTVMRIYVGEDFFEAWYYVPILLIGAVFLGISNYYGAIYASARANLLEIKSTIICAVSNILLNFLLIPQWNILGAVLATAASYGIVVIVRMIDIKKIISIKNPVKNIVFMAVLLVIEIYFTMIENWVMAIVFAMLQCLINILLLKKDGYFAVFKRYLKNKN